MQQEQRFAFDEVAESYDRRRPTYPSDLFREVAGFAKLGTHSRVLEIGCGTGQATVPLANLQCEMICLEPGPSLAAQARKNLSRFPRVQVIEETFEEWRCETPFDLVLSAQAFHWIEPSVAFPKTARVLRECGVLAVLGNRTLSLGGAAAASVAAAYRRHAPGLIGDHPSVWYSGEGPVVDLFRKAARFSEPVHLMYPWSTTYSGAEYSELLATQSDHRLLEASCRAALLADLGEAVAALGGEIEISYEAHLYLARVVEPEPATNGPLGDSQVK